MGKIVPECVLWPETDVIAPLVRERAIDEAIDAWDDWQETGEYPPLWGDEIEYTLLSLDKDAERANHCLRSPELLSRLNKTTKKGEDDTYSPELAQFQIESQPPVPYANTVESLLSVEKNMADRRATIKKHLSSHEFPLTTSNHPRFGCPADVRASLTTSTALTASGERYLTAQHNMTSRRRPGPTIHIPLFRDTNTFTSSSSSSSSSSSRSSSSNSAPLPSFIDASGADSGTGSGTITFDSEETLLGVSQCCLQATFQARSAHAARRLHDALVPLAPVLLALTAATPAYRGMLADTDARWNVIVQLADDRTAAERSKRGSSMNPRYWCAESYVAREAGAWCGGEEEEEEGGGGNGAVRAVQKRLECGGKGFDAVLARYYARVLMRPLLIYPVECARALLSLPQLRRDSGAAVDVVNGKETVCEKAKNGAVVDGGHQGEHRPLPPGCRGKRQRRENFECLAGALYPSVKLKHPSPDDPALGWRVEFRVMENSLSDFENAAFVVFVALVRRAVERYNITNWYVPMEQVWENMERAHARDAVRWQRFWWAAAGGDGEGEKDRSAESALLTIDEIVNGCPSFRGLMALLDDYMTDENFSAAEKGGLRPYLDIVSGRASGKLCTTARFIRDFVTRHAEYAKDSQVSEKICFDLMQEMVEIMNGKRDCGLFQFQ